MTDRLTRGDLDALDPLDVTGPDPTTEMVTFRAIGDPQPKGSWKVIRGNMVPAGGEPQVAWDRAVRAEAEQAARHLARPLDGPLGLDVAFRFRMPASRKPSVLREGWGWCAVPPDLDKLIRLVGDALKVAGAIRDDARICAIYASKYEVAEGWIGADVRIRQLAPGRRIDL